MHPKKIIDDFKSFGASFVLENGELFLQDHKEVTPELIEFAKQYKKRIIAYLEGGYSAKDHSVKSTIDKIVTYMIGENHDATTKINNWLVQDYEAMQLIITLMQKFYDAGWKNFDESIANYETPETDKLSLEIFNRAMQHFKKGA